MKKNHLFYSHLLSIVVASFQCNWNEVGGGLPLEGRNQCMLKKRTEFLLKSWQRFIFVNEKSLENGFFLIHIFRNGLKAGVLRNTCSTK